MCTSLWARPPSSWPVETGTTRRDQDEWALESQRRAERAIESGYFAREIVPVATAAGTVVRADDGPRPGTTLEALSSLKPVFHESGTVTAGNASPLNDGASALVVMSARRAGELGLKPLARILGSAASGLSPEIMGLGPVDASRRLLDRLGLSMGDIDIVELNEAFAAQVVPVVRKLGADPERVNPFGGAIALGHPFGATGVRLVGTLINGLQTTDGSLGLATLCVGGGQGMAMVVERLVMNQSAIIADPARSMLAADRSLEGLGIQVLERQRGPCHGGPDGSRPRWPTGTGLPTVDWSSRWRHRVRHGREHVRRRNRDRRGFHLLHFPGPHLRRNWSPPLK